MMNGLDFVVLFGRVLFGGVRRAGGGRNGARGGVGEGRRRGAVSGRV